MSKLYKHIKITFAIATLFSCNSKYPIQIGKNYKVDIDGNNRLCILRNYNTIIVAPLVTQFNNDSTFIIAEQKPVDLILKSTENNPNINLDERKIILKASALKRYWIINKQNDSIYGPLLQDDYLKKRTVLNISKQLELKRFNIQFEEKKFN